MAMTYRQFLDLVQLNTVHEVRVTYADSPGFTPLAGWYVQDKSTGSIKFKFSFGGKSISPLVARAILEGSA